MKRFQVLYDGDCQVEYKEMLESLNALFDRKLGIASFIGGGDVSDFVEQQIQQRKIRTRKRSLSNRKSIPYGCACVYHIEHEEIKPDDSHFQYFAPHLAIAQSQLLDKDQSGSLLVTDKDIYAEERNFVGGVALSHKGKNFGVVQTWCFKPEISPITTSQDVIGILENEIARASNELKNLKSDLPQLTLLYSVIELLYSPFLLPYLIKRRKQETHLVRIPPVKRYLDQIKSEIERIEEEVNFFDSLIRNAKIELGLFEEYRPQVTYMDRITQTGGHECFHMLGLSEHREDPFCGLNDWDTVSLTGDRYRSLDYQILMRKIDPHLREYFVCEECMRELLQKNK